MSTAPFPSSMAEIPTTYQPYEWRKSYDKKKVTWIAVNKTNQLPIMIDNSAIRCFENPKQELQQLYRASKKEIRWTNGRKATGNSKSPSVKNIGIKRKTASANFKYASNEEKSNNVNNSGDNNSKSSSTKIPKKAKLKSPQNKSNSNNGLDNSASNNSIATNSSPIHNNNILGVALISASPVDVDGRVAQTTMINQINLELLKAVGSNNTHNMQVKAHTDCTNTQLLSFINSVANQVDIIHILCHMSGDVIEVQNDLGFSHLISSKTLLNMLTKEDSVQDDIWYCKGKIKLVVLTGCENSKMAKLLTSRIPYVIGTTRSVSNAEAIAFASYFYGGLMLKKSIREALLDANTQVTACNPASNNENDDAFKIYLAPGKSDRTIIYNPTA